MNLLLVPSVKEQNMKDHSSFKPSAAIEQGKHDVNYYMKCALGGALACGSTHFAMTPVDVTKCNMQVDNQKYRGLFSGMRTIIREEGAMGLTKGWAPTLIGYSMQGMFKYGLYEFFKDYYSHLAGDEAAKQHKRLIWLAGSASAEVFADIALCPMEMVKVKVQTSAAGSWPTGLVPATQLIMMKRAETRFPLGSLVPLWSRQIPYTMAKFFFFEGIVELFYSHLLTQPKQSYSKPVQLGVSFASGYLAGIVCAIVSHPADTLVSLLGKPSNRGKSLATIARDFGYGNLCVKGLGTRIVMIGTLTGFQWWIYDSAKTAMGLQTSGGK